MRQRHATTLKLPRARVAPEGWGVQVCSDMRIGVFGATGPAGQAAAVQLAADRVEVTVGSRAFNAPKRRVAALKGRWPDRDLPLFAGDNETAAAAADW